MPREAPASDSPAETGDTAEVTEPAGRRVARAALLGLAALGVAQGAAHAAAAPVPALAADAAVSRASDAGFLDRLQEGDGLPSTLWDEPLRLGDTGDRVERFSEALAHFQPVEVTDTFDETLEEAVKAFQSGNDLRPDGVVGERTYGVLFARLFWEKGVVANLNGSDLKAHLPEKVRLVVDVERQALFLVDGSTGQAFRRYPVSTGTDEFPTPLQRFKISHRHEKPYWNPPPSDWAKGEKRTPPGPTNPLGVVALRLSGSSILIHGVPQSSFGTLGKRGASHGCIRMFPQHAWELSEILDLGTRVDVVASSTLEVPVE